MLGRGPTHDRLGFRYWNDPDAFNSYIVPGSGGQFTAFLWVWVYSGFSFYFTVFYPGQFTASGFLTTYLGIPLFLALYIGHRLTIGREYCWAYKPEEVDLVSGVEEVNADAWR